MMKTIKSCFHFILILAFTVTLLPVAHAAGYGNTPPKRDWPHNGIFGTYDKSALQRGYQVYRENCAACHGMDYLAYRNLEDIGFTENEVKAIAMEYMVEDGPNDEGDMFERVAIPADRFVNPYPNDNAARFANNGAMPVDLSLIVKARAHGENYIYALLTGYTEPPEGQTLEPGQYWNEYMPGHLIAMPPPLADGSITYSNGEPATLSQAAADVAQFLAWASEPYADQRKQMGMKVILYLIFFAGILYMVKRKVWRDIKK